MSAAIFDVTVPQRFDRVQVVLRVVIIWLAALIGIPLWWILYLGFPVLSAVLIAQKDGSRYLSEDGPRVTGWLRAVTAALAYLWILTAIPSAFILALLLFASAIVWIVAAIWVLFAETYSETLYGFQRGIVRWMARLLAYLASLVDTYPPFSLDMGPELD